MNHLANTHVEISYCIYDTTKLDVGDILDAIHTCRDLEVRIVEVPNREDCPHGVVLVAFKAAAGYAVTDTELAEMVTAHLDEPI